MLVWVENPPTKSLFYIATVYYYFPGMSRTINEPQSP
jgi:hypothetical protein